MSEFEIDNQCYAHPKRYKLFDMRRHHEVLALLDNLDTLKKGLDGGLQPEQIRTLDFIFPEPSGVLAIGQSGGGRVELAEARLYVYVNTASRVIHLITFGDKASQQQDILRTCSDFIKKLRQEEDKSHGED